MTAAIINQVAVQSITKADTATVECSYVAVQYLELSPESAADIHQVVIQSITKADTATVEASFVAVQLLVIPPADLEFTICYEDGSTPSTDTYDYVILLGDDVATATFLEAGTVLITDGEGTIEPSSGSPGNSVILILQLGNNLGAYEGTLV